MQELVQENIKLRIQLQKLLETRNQPEFTQILQLEQQLEEKDQELNQIKQQILFSQKSTIQKQVSYFHIHFLQNSSNQMDKNKQLENLKNQIREVERQNHNLKIEFQNIQEENLQFKTRLEQLENQESIQNFDDLNQQLQESQDKILELQQQILTQEQELNQLRENQKLNQSELDISNVLNKYQDELMAKDKMLKEMESEYKAKLKKQEQKIFRMCQSIEYYEQTIKNQQSQYQQSDSPFNFAKKSQKETIKPFFQIVQIQSDRTEQSEQHKNKNELNDQQQQKVKRKLKVRSQASLESDENFQICQQLDNQKQVNQQENQQVDVQPQIKSSQQQSLWIPEFSQKIRSRSQSNEKMLKQSLSQLLQGTSPIIANRRFNYSNKYSSVPSIYQMNNSQIPIVIHNEYAQKKVQEKNSVSYNPYHQDHPLHRFIINPKIRTRKNSEIKQSIPQVDILPYIKINPNQSPSIPNLVAEVLYLKEIKTTLDKVDNPYTKSVKQKSWKLLETMLLDMKQEDGWDQSIYYNGNQIQGRGIGPSGIIACLNAYFIKHYHYILKIQNKKYVPGSNLTNIGLKNGVIGAMSEILYKVSRETNRIIVVKLKNHTSKLPLLLDKCEFIALKAENFVQIYAQMQNFQNVYFDRKQYGLHLFLYSVIFTKGVEKLIEEFDNPSACLINHQGYANQELINMLLTGYATSNCFDGQINRFEIIQKRKKILDENFIMRGIESKNEVGFLTINEYFRFVEVGEYYKSPSLPIWVIFLGKYYQILYGWTNNIINECISFQFLMFIIAPILQEFDVIYISSFNIDPNILKVTRYKNSNEETQSTIKMILKTKWGNELKIDSREWSE